MKAVFKGFLTQEEIASSPGTIILLDQFKASREEAEASDAEDDHVTLEEGFKKHNPHLFKPIVWPAHKHKEE